MISNTAFITFFLPITMGCVEIFKRAGLSERWLPLLALGVGVLFSFLFGAWWADGLIVGLASVGLFSGVKNMNQWKRRLVYSTM